MEKQFVAVVLEEADNGRRTVPVISSTIKNAGADTVTRHTDASLCFVGRD